MNDTVRVEKLDQVTLVTLDRRAARNAVDAATARLLHDAFLAFERDAGARVAVFHGAHGHFCAGWDLRAGARAADEASCTAAAQDMADALAFDADDPAPIAAMGPSRLLLSKPVVAAISGAAVAGGMELALWCDLRVMEQDAYFGVYCRRFGVPLIDGGTVRLPRLIGMGHAMDLILTGRRVDADEALRIGLCNRVVPPGAARDAALILARQIAAFPQGALRADRASAHAQWGLPLAAALRQEWERGRHCIAEGLEGAARFASGQGRHGEF